MLLFSKGKLLRIDQHCKEPKKGQAMYPSPVPLEHVSIVTEITMNQFAHISQEQLIHFMQY